MESAELISRGMYAEAWRLLKQDSGKEPDKLFNRALCMVFAKKYREALSLLDEAFAKTKSVPAAPGDETSALVLAEQNKSAAYRAPVTTEYINLFPGFFRESIVRIKIDCCAALEQWREVLALAAPLGGKKYANVEAARELAGKHAGENHD